jgi:hypothetical protein
MTQPNASTAPPPRLLPPLWALFRKELHEYWSALLLGCFIVGGFTALGLHARLMPDLMVIVVAAFPVGGVLFPLMLATGVVAPERAEGSVNTLLRLPMAAATVLAVKTVVASVVALTPIALSLLIAITSAGGREISAGQLFTMHIIGAALALNVLLWTVCVGIRQPNEARVGLVGVGLIVLMAALIYSTDNLLPYAWYSTFVSCTPAGLLIDGVPTVTQLFTTAWRQAIVLTLLWLITAWRFGRPGRTRG